MLQKIKKKFTKQPSVKHEKIYAIEITNFTKKFKKFVAVDNIDIKIPQGVIHGFIGPNGAGKTTTIKSLISALIPTTGRLKINGLDSHLVEAKKQIGYIPESARFPKRISTFNYLVSMAQVSGLNNKDSKLKAQEILENLKLWQYRKRNPNNYSSGMKKKVLLAQALINNPKVLILDEPAANLDPSARTELFNDLKKLRKEKKTVFISSHILSELQFLVDEVTILNHGKVVYHGNLGKIQDDSRDHKNQKYAIHSNDNAKLEAILIENKFRVKAESYNLIVTIDHQKELNRINSLAIKSNIIINSLNRYTVDLQSLYERVVLKANLQESVVKK